MMIIREELSALFLGKIKVEGMPKKLKMIRKKAVLSQTHFSLLSGERNGKEIKGRSKLKERVLPSTLRKSPREIRGRCSNPIMHFCSCSAALSPSLYRTDYLLSVKLMGVTPLPLLLKSPRVQPGSLGPTQLDSSTGFEVGLPSKFRLFGQLFHFKFCVGVLGSNCLYLHRSKFSLHQQYWKIKIRWE